MIWWFLRKWKWKWKWGKPNIERIAIMDLNDMLFCIYIDVCRLKSHLLWNTMFFCCWGFSWKRTFVCNERAKMMIWNPITSLFLGLFNMWEIFMFKLLWLLLSLLCGGLSHVQMVKIFVNNFQSNDNITIHLWIEINDIVSYNDS